jgi:iron complex transport system ATP-binding protein
VENRPVPILGILGPNGSGKTTLLRLLSGALTPSSGSITLDGRNLTSIPRRELARRIAIVPQETALAFDYTVLEIVLMGRYPHLKALEIEGPEDVQVCLKALEATGTSAFADRPFRTLSGGEKQRVVIASALAQLGGLGETGHGRHGSSSGQLLVLDEPTASLDLKYQFEVAALVRRIHDESGITILLSTHDLRFAAATCTRIILLSAGRILAEGPPSEVLTPALVGRLFDVEPALTVPILSAATQ